MLKAPTRIATSALIPFIPRQVMLGSKSSTASDNKTKGNEMEKEHKKKKKLKGNSASETLENGSTEPKTLTSDNEGANGKSRRRILSSIAAFLESNGFHKSLSVFRSETELESDGTNASCINLEDMFSKFLESSGDHERAASNGLKEKDTQNTDASIKHEIEHVKDVAKNVHKKKRKHNKEHDDRTNSEAEEHGLDITSDGLNSLSNGTDIEKSEYAKDLHVEIKDEKMKKKSRGEVDPDKNHLENGCKVACDRDAHDTTKKKKKHKMTSDGCREEKENTGSEDNKENFQVIVEEKIAEPNSLADMFNLPSESNAVHEGEKKKKKKKKKKKAEVSVSPAADDSKSTGEVPKESEVVIKRFARETDDNFNGKAHKKRKKVDSKTQASEQENGTTAEESKDGKLDGAENNKQHGTQKTDKSLPDSEHTAISKKKTKKSCKSSEEAAKASGQEQNPGNQDEQEESGPHRLANNGEGEKNEKEGTTASKSKKGEKRSTEPKTVNAFQRVKIDEVKFANERLQDNSYWALDNTGSGYGAKAQEVLGQVKGRDFRHEKTKKKRGTYRGGQIDLQAHSIKFNYSDEE